MQSPLLHFYDNEWNVFILAEDHNLNVSVHWMAPFFSGGGYCSEAVAFVSSLFRKFVNKIVFVSNETIALILLFLVLQICPSNNMAIYSLRHFSMAFQTK
jgi:hypothetical protein